MRRRASGEATAADLAVGPDCGGKRRQARIFTRPWSPGTPEWPVCAAFGTRDNARLSRVPHFSLAVPQLAPQPRRLIRPRPLAARPPPSSRHGSGHGSGARRFGGAGAACQGTFGPHRARRGRAGSGQGVRAARARSVSYWRRTTNRQSPPHHRRRHGSGKALCIARSGAAVIMRALDVPFALPTHAGSGLRKGRPTPPARGALCGTLPARERRPRSSSTCWVPFASSSPNPAPLVWIACSPRLSRAARRFMTWRLGYWRQRTLIELTRSVRAEPLAAGSCNKICACVHFRTAAADFLHYAPALSWRTAALSIAARIAANRSSNSARQSPL